MTDDGGPRGYALYRTKESWGPGGAEGTLDIREVAATDPAAHRALWRVLLGTDLVGEVSYYNLPVDDPLTRLLVDPRRAAPRLVDALFTRLVDVARALTARTYAVPVEVVLDLDDPFCPWNTGCWRLSGGPDGATCAPTTEDADLSLDAQALGALFLGGTSLRALADAGMVEGAPLGSDRRHRAGLQGCARALVPVRLLTGAADAGGPCRSCRSSTPSSGISLGARGSRGNACRGRGTDSSSVSAPRHAPSTRRPPVSSSNLTRDEARERARLLTVDSYDVSLDLTTGDKVFRSETTAQFSCSEDGASVRLDLVAETVHEIVLNGTSLDPFEVHREDGLHLKGLEPTNVLRVVADLPLHAHRARDCTASSTRSTGRSTSTPSTRPTTPTAPTPASTSPTSRRPSPSR